MSDTALAIADQPTPRQIGRREASKPAKVTGRLKRALDLMVWDAKRDNEAAVETGITISAIRIALKQPHVRAYYREQIEVLRGRESARNIHRAIEIRDAANNMPAIHAIRYLDGEDAENARQLNAMHRSPGLTVVVVQGAAEVRNAPVLDVTPSEDNGSGE